MADVTVAYLGHRFIADLRIQMFAKLAKADLSWIQTVHSGRLLSSFLNDANLIRATASRSIVTIGENALKVIILVGSMMFMDPRFSVLILIFMPFAWFMLTKQRKKMRKSTTKSLQETGDLSALITQTLARHARGARLPAGGPGRAAGRQRHQPRARVHHARHAGARHVEPVDGADRRLRLCARHLLSPARKAFAAISRSATSWAS